MFQEYHALPVQASIMLHKFPDTVEQMMAMFLSWRGLLQRSFMKFQQNIKRGSEEFICARGKKERDLLNNTSMTFLPYFLMKSSFNFVDEKVSPWESNCNLSNTKGVFIDYSQCMVM